MKKFIFIFLIFLNCSSNELANTQERNWCIYQFEKFSSLFEPNYRKDALVFLSRSGRTIPKDFAQEILQLNESFEVARKLTSSCR